MVMTASNPTTHKTATYTLDLHSWTVNNLNPDPLKSLGIIPIRPNLPAIITQVSDGGPAKMAGLQANDKVVSMNGVLIKDWYHLLEYIQAHPNQKVLLTFERQGQIHTTTVTIRKKPMLGFRTVGYLGIQTTPIEVPENMKLFRQYPPGRALFFATADTWQYLLFNVVIFKKLIVGQISLSTLGGPIAILQIADLAFRQGVSVFFGFLALISIMLAFMNLLPIPGLDGGYLFNYLIELVMGKPIPLKYELMSIRIGFMVLLLFILVATFNDILRLLS